LRVDGEFVRGDQPLTMRVDQMVQHCSLRSLRSPDQLREFPVPAPRVAFGDVSRARTRRLTELLAELEVTPKLRTPQEHLDAEVHLMSQLPGGDFSEVFAGGHGTESCKRVACTLSPQSRLIVSQGARQIEEFAMFQIFGCGNFCCITSQTM